MILEKQGMKIKIYNLKTIGLWLDAKSLEIRKKEKKRKEKERKEKKISGIKKGENKSQETNHELH